MVSQTQIVAPAERAAGTSDDRRTLGAALTWALLVVVALVVSQRTVGRVEDAGLAAAPFDGHWGWKIGWRLLPAAVVGLAMVHLAPRLAVRLPWRALLVAAGTATVVWAVVLAASDGWERVSAPLASEHEYLAAVDQIDDPREFVRTYTERLDDYPVHVRGHPPGMTLLVWGLDRVGLGGSGWAAALTLTGAGVATAATLVAVRSVAGSAAARRAAPFVAVAPAALWFGTSADALFAGLGAVGSALLIAAKKPHLHLAGGAVLALTLHFSYGAALLLVIPAAVLVWRRDLRPLIPAMAGAGLVTALAVATGFWWFDGLASTRHFYVIGISQYRPYLATTFVTNPAALALAVGPAVAAGLWSLRTQLEVQRIGHLFMDSAAEPPRGQATRAFPLLAPKALGLLRSLRSAHWSPAVLPLAALAGIVVADLSGFCKGEVERIWLPFMPWLLTATAVLPDDRARLWLGAQATLAVVLQAALRSPW
jgi:hypothetical protein